MSSDNPFEVTSGAYGDRTRADRDVTQTEVSRRTIDLLAETRPWVQLMGVLLWIGTVFLVLGSIGVLIAAAMSGDPTMVILGVVYFVMVFVYAYLARSLTGYSRRINNLVASESVLDLEDAIEAQKNFWKVLGIITLVTILIYVLFIVLAVAGVAFFGNFMNR